MRRAHLELLEGREGVRPLGAPEQPSLAGGTGTHSQNFRAASVFNSGQVLRYQVGSGAARSREFISVDTVENTMGYTDSIGLGRIVALYYYSSTSCQIH